MAEALYRKYRPQIFEDVVGQEHIERTIKNAIDQDKVSHAYLFCGPRGTGKTTTARLLAKALLCQGGPTSSPDGACEDCLMIAAGEHPDVYELDAASRTGVENVREEIIGRVQFAPTRGRYKVYIIDEVHMLSTAAFNALLKTLEEPPAHVVFILATTDPQKVPETIHSRCQRFDFRRISTEAIVSRLGAICIEEGVEFEGDALELVAHKAEGGMRNALTSLEQLIAFGEGKVTMKVAESMLGSLATSDLAEIVRFVGTRDVAACFCWTAEFVETGADLAQFARDLAEHVRNMYVMSLAGTDVALDVSEATRRELTEEMALFGPDRLARLLGVLGDLSAELKTSTNPRLSFEIALTRMVRPDADLTLEALAERIEALEAGYSSVAHVVSGAAVPAVASAGERAATSTAAFAGASTAASAVASADAHVAGASDMRAEARAVEASGPVGTPASEAAMGGDAIGHGPVAATSNETAAVGAPATQPQPQVQPQLQAQPVSTVSEAPLPDSLVQSLQNPAALQRMWQSALARLKKEKAAYGVLFLNTKASFDGTLQSIVVEFPAENDFAFSTAQKPDVQDKLALAWEHSCGTAVPLRLVKTGSRQGVVATGAASAVQASQSASNPVLASSESSSVVAASGAAPVAGMGAITSSVAASSAGAVEPSVSASAPVAASASVSRTTASAVAPASDGYDEVPVDLYEDIAYQAPYGFDGGFANEAPRQAPTPSPTSSAAGNAAFSPEAAASMGAGSASPSKPASGQAPSTASAEPDRTAFAASGGSGDQTIEELNEALAFGFGEGVSFREDLG